MNYDAQSSLLSQLSILLFKLSKDRVAVDKVAIGLSKYINEGQYKLTEKVRLQGNEIKRLTHEIELLTSSGHTKPDPDEVTRLKQRINWGKNMDRTRRGGYRQTILRVAKENERLRERIATKDGKILPI